MSKSNIEWTEDTWNPIVGCSLKSPGCIHCYAMPMAARIEAINTEARLSGKPAHAPQYDGTTTKVKGKPVFTGKVAMAPDSVLLRPLGRKKPTMYFVNSMGDLFHESVPDEWIDRVFAVMALTPQHTYQVLTKRADRMRDYVRAARNRIVGKTSDGHANVSLMTPKAYHSTTMIGGNFDWPLPNVWLGVSTERQLEADERIPLLLQTPAAVRFISAEPLLGPIDLSKPFDSGRPYLGLPIHQNPHDQTWHQYGRSSPHLDWVITGGESGTGARPMHPYWARQLRDQCMAGGVPFFFKQWGDWTPICAMSEDQINHCYHPAPEHQPDATRREKTESVVLHAGGARFDGDARFRSGAFPQDSGAMTMFRIGKPRAGRALDGELHDAMPTDHRITQPTRKAQA